jgi:hypothetical protein
MRGCLGDLFWMAVAFLISTAVAFWLHTQGVDEPALPDWFTGL